MGGAFLEACICTGEFMVWSIDLNCDMGESFGAWKMGQDEEILPYVSSANIACGFHAGDPATMRQTVAAAIRHGVALGRSEERRVGQECVHTCRSRGSPSP